MYGIYPLLVDRYVYHTRGCKNVLTMVINGVRKYFKWCF